jgi:hypothetical protein
MKTILRVGWLAPVLALGMAVRAGGQDAPSAGAVLILGNDRVMEGAIDKVGDEYRVRRGMSETYVAANRAKRVCADWDEALTFMRSQANLGDPDERLRLARWCQQCGLKEEAIVEARAALEMRPSHAESKQLLHLLQRPAATAPTAQPAVAKTLPKLRQLDLSSDALALFSTKVQPILMNTCAHCHSHGQGGNFQLQRALDGGARAATHRNLTMAVTYLNFENPAASPLLVKSVSAHGGADQPPLRDRRVVAFLAMQQWAQQVAVNNPHLRDARVAAAPVRPAPEIAEPAPLPMIPANAVTPVVSRVVARVEPVDAQTTPGSAKSTVVAQQGQPAPPAPMPRAEAPSATANPADVFDPTEFNRRNAPQK